MAEAGSSELGGDGGEQRGPGQARMKERKDSLWLTAGRLQKGRATEVQTELAVPGRSGCCPT